MSEEAPRSRDPPAADDAARRGETTDETLTLHSSLDKIRESAAGRVRIVLHGTNGFPVDIMQRCIEGGVSKINVNKLVLDDYLVHVQENAAKQSLTQFMEEGVVKAQKLMEWQMDVVKSSGKA